MGKCVVVCAGEPCVLEEWGDFSVSSQDFVICADAGVSYALEQRLPVNLVVGDFDSGRVTREDVEQLGLPVYGVASEKDDTDTMLAVKIGLEKGYRDFVLLCALGGRLDHTWANIATLSYLKSQGANGWIYGKREQITMLEGESLHLPRQEAKLSLFSYTEQCEGVTVSGVKYPLEEALLTQHFPLGVSNEFTAGQADIQVRKGQLLVMTVREDPV